MDPDTVEQMLREMLTSRMDEHGVTPAALAQRAGISRPHVSRILRAKRPASTAVWSRLLAAAKPPTVVVATCPHGRLDGTWCPLPGCKTKSHGHTLSP